MTGSLRSSKRSFSLAALFSTAPAAINRLFCTNDVPVLQKRRRHRRTNNIAVLRITTSSNSIRHKRRTNSSRPGPLSAQHAILLISRTCQCRFASTLGAIYIAQTSGCPDFDKPNLCCPTKKGARTVQPLATLLEIE
ncbi:hypothetical protein BT63DRAFT_84435 [Microthyrium microscopicum]|uniref:Uncharacterized protein n=1 Tax=Microthyrium microscopicum TaxID=703497 RepID=A0A6A6U087_9PEZI|nr:hypothetical protein BT63DRAFT_84435 [Microthyrium microscopicum]